MNNCPYANGPGFLLLKKSRLFVDPGSYRQKDEDQTAANSKKDHGFLESCGKEYLFSKNRGHFGKLRFFCFLSFEIFWRENMLRKKQYFEGFYNFFYILTLNQSPGPVPSDEKIKIV